MSRRIDDPDWAVQLPSIWDEAEDDDAQDALWFETSETALDPFASPLPHADRRVDWHQAEA